MGTSKHLSYTQKLCFGVGHAFNHMCLTSWYTYLLLYLQFVIQLPPSIAGIVLLTGLIANGLATPLTGYFTDRFKPCWNYGKRKTIHLIFSLASLITFPLIFVKFPGFNTLGYWSLLAYFLPLVIIWGISNAAVHVAHLSMIPELSPDQLDRDEITIFRYIFDVAADISLYIISWIILSAGVAAGTDEAVGSDDSWKFSYIVAIVTGMGAVMIAIFHLGTPEEIEQEQGSNSIEEDTAQDSNTARNSEGSLFSVNMNWSDWFREKHFFFIGLLLVLARMYFNLNQTFIPLFLQEGIKAEEEILAVIPLTLQVSGLIASCLVRLLLKVVNKKVGYMIATCFAYAGCIWLGYDSQEALQSGNVYILTVLIGIGSSLMLVLSVSLTSDLIGTNTESGAFVFGAITFVEKTLNGLFIVIVQTGHTFCEDCPTYYREVIAHGISAIAILSLAVVLKLNPHTVGTRYSEMNTVQGRKESVARKSSKSYGSMRKGFPILERPTISS
ncbi:Major facilitator superfamily domain-containing protein 12 [Orchesella cincta]|uniref:Major facilitator superfamily domain-containing protein 12 n=1 Tax=Orchesella cincta TaxID=48709 RepID=A0A1D2NFI9_ORCCI|nr:Major facilitator superfamily domain-containing protein 12 [Orchesella cincta]